MNPFKENTTSYYDWEVLKDLKWHCTKCELKSGQAKTWQVWRQSGIVLDIDEKGHFFKTIICNKCNNKTIHRKLKSLDIFKNQEAMLLREMPPKELEVDHKFPQVRWNSNEKENPHDMSETDIKSKFILLTRSNNLLKSRFCENCFKTGKRGYFPGIFYWYSGNDEWTTDKYNEKGCIGCFWYDPYKWREELNKIIKSES